MRRSLPIILLAAAVARLSVWTHVFAGGRTWIDGPDGYYHLRRAFLTLQRWPHVPSTDSFMSVPLGSRISWPPLFDGLLATLALPWRSSAPIVALERIGALLPSILGILQVALIVILTRLIASHRAALITGAVAALFPTLVRYTLVGTLDHDPFFECALLLALIGIAAAPRRGGIIAATTGITLATLGWAGAIVGIAIVAAFAVARAITSEGSTRIAIGRTLFVTNFIAAIIALPFVASSPWEGATFEGLSWLHETMLLGAALVGAIIAWRDRRVAIGGAVALLGTIALLPISVLPLLRGLFYAAGHAPILAGVAETQPLLFLFGRFDLWPALIRFGFLPLLAIIALRRKTQLPLATWCIVALGLALLHSRFSYTAATPLCIAGGIAIDELLATHSRLRVAIAGLLMVAPTLIAYLPVPGFTGFNFYERTTPILASAAPGACDYLRAAAAEDPALRNPFVQPAWSVLAPWYHGHWIMWIGHRATVINPMLSVGQPAFDDGMRFFVQPGELNAMNIAKRHLARYIVVTPDLRSLPQQAAMIGLAPPRDLREAMHVLPMHLAYWGASGVRAFGDDYPALPFDEVWRSREVEPGPFGLVPLMRIYRVRQQAAGSRQQEKE